MHTKKIDDSKISKSLSFKHFKSIIENFALHYFYCDFSSKKSTLDYALSVERKKKDLSFFFKFPKKKNVFRKRSFTEPSMKLLQLFSI